MNSFPRFETPENEVLNGSRIITLKQILDRLNDIKEELDSFEVHKAGGEIKSKRRKSKRRKSRKLRIRKSRKSRKLRKSRR